MRVSQFYKLKRNQSTLDFVDVKVNADLPIFVNPAAIKSLDSTWGAECTSLLQTFFSSVLKHVKSRNDAVAKKLLSSLNERNEFHLGFSKGKSNGHAFGADSAESVWNALTKSKASASGLIEDLEDSCLVIPGIGKDMISDAICNIIRGPLIRYTQDMCDYYGIPMSDGVQSGPIWDPISGEWQQNLIKLPVTKYGRLVLIPKIIVRYDITFNYEEYYRHYLLPAMQIDEINANTALVKTLKSGKKKVTKKALKEKYGADKLAVVEQSIKRPQILAQYKKEKLQKVPPPLSNEDLAHLQKTQSIDWQKFLKDLRKIKPGQENATQYENHIESILTALFYPALCYPKKQHPIHEGRKRIDITYVNTAKGGFFEWLSKHYASQYIHIECKNYEKQIKNPELDQLSGRFSPNRGQVGFSISRTIENRKKLLESCRDTSKDQRGYIIALDDSDIEAIVTEKIKKPDSIEFPLLREYFAKLVS